jgi:glycosyltransferase involved in cell wall biosynthesis
VDPTKVEVVYPGVQEEFRATAIATNCNPTREIVDGQEYILAVGPVQPYKNLDLLIRAFGSIKTRGFPHSLVIASSGQPVPSNLKRLVDEIGVAGEVRFIERFLSREELASLYSGATVFVHPSSGEQFGLTVAEAMACGAPVIVSDLGPFREQVGDAGIIVEVGNLEALCDGIFAVLSKPSLQKEMAHRSLERSRQFSWNLSAHRMIAIFKEAVGDCGGL